MGQVCDVQFALLFHLRICLNHVLYPMLNVIYNETHNYNEAQKLILAKQGPPLLSNFVGQFSRTQTPF